MRITALLILFALFPAISSAVSLEGNSEGKKFRVEVLLENLGVIWGFDFLPSGEVLLTERDGGFKIWNPSTKKLTHVSGAPEVAPVGQGGLLDVRVDPTFTKNKNVYLTYAKAVPGGYTTALARGRLEGLALKDLTDIFVANAVSDNKIHFGSRIVFLGEYLFLSIGERNEREKAQLLSVDNGKIIRIRHDGSDKKIWSYGHRNPQGLALHPKTNQLWEVEMGPRGGDEINLIQEGKNYGWPKATYGREYWGPSIGETHVKGTEQPIAYYVPSISPSGIAFYNGDKFPHWKNNLFLGTLSGEHLRRVVLSGAKVMKQEVLLENLGWRLRCVRNGPDGYLYFSTDEGRFARIIPE